MKKKAVLLLLVNLILTLLDGLLTWLATPDLKLEGNPLVKHLGLGWGALFLVNLIFFSLLCVSTYYSFVCYQTKYFDVAGKRTYLSMLFFNKPDCFKKLFYSMRFSDWRPFWAICGYCFIYAFIVSRAILVFQWILFLTDTKLRWYSALRHALPFAQLDIWAALLCICCLIPYWMIKEARKNETHYRALSQQPTG